MELKNYLVSLFKVEFNKSELICSNMYTKEDMKGNYENIPNKVGQTITEVNPQENFNYITYITKVF